MIKTGLIKKSITDFFSPKLLSISVVPFFVTFVLLLSAYFGFGADFIDSFKTSMDAGVVPFLDPQKYPTITYILTIGVFKWFFFIFFYLVFALLLILLSVIVATIVIGFFTPLIVRVIQKRHYKEFVIDNSDFTLGFTIFHFIKTFIVFMFLFLIALPFLFVPAVNFIAINIPFYYLFHNFLVLDVGSNINSKEEFKSLIKEHKLLFRSTTLTLYSFSLIPLMGILFQVLFVIILSHQFFTKSIEARR